MSVGSKGLILEQKLLRRDAGTPSNLGRLLSGTRVAMTEKLDSTKIMRFLPLVVIFLLCSLSAHAKTFSANSCSQSDVQNAINSAAKGDHILVPGGSCTWSSTVTIPASLYINLDGGGKTTIAGVLSFTANTSGETEVTGFTWTGNGSNANAITVDGCGGLNGCGGVVTSTWRIDHNTFTTGVQAVFIQIYGNAPGLIDNNMFTGGAASEMIHNLGMGPSDASGWTDNVVPGSANMLFIEDNTFTFPASGNPAYFWGSSAVQSYYGARTVVRHNTMNMVQVDQHGTAGAIGARWWEIYENTFNTTVANANQCCFIVLRAGSGVVFNNHHVGANQSNAGVQLYEEDSGYPALYQIGRGINENLSPAYVWGNDSGMPVGSASSNVTQGTDFFVSTSQPTSMVRRQLSTDTSSTTYSYVPYTYPHPLQGGIAPPTGLKATVQ
jgi:hypothetical protein